jgi:hypothetical protein
MGELRKIKSKLNRENKLLLNKLSSYIYANGVNNKVWNEIKIDLAGMLLECQERGGYSQDVIGNDYKEFCDELIANCPRKKFLDVILEFLFVAGLAILMFIPFLYIWGIFLPSYDEYVRGIIFYCEPYYLGILLSGGFAGGIGSIFLQRLTFSKNRMGRYFIIYFIVYIITYMLVLHVAKRAAENNLVRFNVLVAEIIVLLLFAVNFGLREWRMRNQLKEFAKIGEAS